MINEQILKKAIEKAVKNGYGIPNYRDFYNAKGKLIRNRYFTLIFSHDFAKAFWGTGYKWFKLWSKKGEPKGTKGAKTLNKIEMKQDWEYHLAKMVLEKEPLKYVEKFL